MHTKTFWWAGYAFAAAMLLSAGAMDAGAIPAAITPVGATTSDPLAYGSTLDTVIDGVIDFDTPVYVGHPGAGAYAGPYTVTFDLGAEYDLTGMNLWNNGGAADNDGEGIDAFTLTFFDASVAPVGSPFDANATDTLPMQTFSFDVSGVQYVDLTINSNHATAPERQYALFYETNFIPEPASLMLLAAGMFMIAHRKQ